MSAKEFRKFVREVFCPAYVASLVWIVAVIAAAKLLGVR